MSGVVILESALKGAKEKGIVCDMIVGSGWPFGGEFLSREDQTQMVALGTKNLAGGKTFQILKQELLDSVNPDFHSKYNGKLKELIIVKLVPLNLHKLDECIDLTDQVKQETINITVPAGEYVL